MDNLGDWLYILIIIAAGISGLFSSSKKKKQANQAPKQPAQPQTQTTETHQEPKGFWEILEEMQRQNEPQPQPERPKPAPQPAKTVKKEKPADRIDFVSPTYFEDKAKAAKSRTTTTPLRTVTPPEEDHYFLNTDSFHDTEELKKAIIYSEILNRKY